MNNRRHLRYELVNVSSLVGLITGLEERILIVPEHVLLHHSLDLSVRADQHDANVYLKRSIATLSTKRDMSKKQRIYIKDMFLIKNGFKGSFLKALRVSPLGAHGPADRRLWTPKCQGRGTLRGPQVSVFKRKGKEHKHESKKGRDLFF